MNIAVEFLGPIEQEIKYVDANNLEELSKILNQDNTVSSWLDKSAIAVNDKIIKDIKFNLQDGDRVSILPPVCGG